MRRVRTGSAFPATARRPLGIAIVGGLIVSQALTLYTTPVIYLYLERLSQWMGGRKVRHEEPARQMAAE